MTRTLPLLLALLALPAGAHDYRFPVAVAERVVDADTVVVSLPGTHPLLGGRVKVRVRGINAPESSHRAECNAERELGKKATAAMRQHVAEAKRLELRRAKRGSFFRVVAEVWGCEGGECASLGGKLVESGLAVAWSGTGTRPVPWCSD